jgi:hypothetical protein
MSELIHALDVELQGKDPHAEKRQRIRKLSHSHADDQSSQRLLAAIGLEVKSY